MSFYLGRYRPLHAAVSCHSLDVECEQELCVGCRPVGSKEKQKKLYLVSRFVAGADMLVCILSSAQERSLTRESFALQLELQQHLQDLLQKAGVERVHELLSANVAKNWPRTARVNLLKMTVAEALAWVRAPPATHKKWAHLVRCPALPCPAPPCPVLLCLPATNVYVNIVWTQLWNFRHCKLSG